MLISPRENLRAELQKHPALYALPQVAALTQHFDMCRAVGSQEKDLAAKYGVLEHLMRSSTPNELVETMFGFMSQTLALKLSDIIDRKEEIGELAIREMEAVVTEEDLRESEEMPVLQVCYYLRNGAVVKQCSEPDQEGAWPIVHLFQSEELLLILYSNEVTFLDNYDPFTGIQRSTLITQFLVDAIVPSLYFHQKRRTYSTQTKPPKEVQEVRVPEHPLEPVRPLVLTPSPETSLNEISAPLFTDRSEEDLEHLPENPEFQAEEVEEEVDPILLEEEQQAASPPVEGSISFEVAEQFPVEAAEPLDLIPQKVELPELPPQKIAPQVPKPAEKDPFDLKPKFSKRYVARRTNRRRTRRAEDGPAMEAMGDQWEWVRPEKTAKPKELRKREGCEAECCVS